MVCLVVRNFWCPICTWMPNPYKPYLHNKRAAKWAMKLHVHSLKSAYVNKHYYRYSWNTPRKPSIHWLCDPIMHRHYNYSQQIINHFYNYWNSVNKTYTIRSPGMDPLFLILKVMSITEIRITEKITINKKNSKQVNISRVA